MALYTNESKDRVRDAADFLEIVSARSELRRAGPARYEGLCPFHDERTPSFGIDPAQIPAHVGNAISLVAERLAHAPCNLARNVGHRRVGVR